MRIVRGKMARLGAIGAAAVLGGAGLGVVGLAGVTPAGAATTNLNVVYNVPILGGYGQQPLVIADTAPATASQGTDFTSTFAPGPQVVPATESLGPITVPVKSLQGIVTIIPLPANATYVSSSVSGPATWTGPSTGSLPLTVTECTTVGQTGCTGSTNGKGKAGSFNGTTALPYLELSTPGAVASGTKPVATPADEIPGGVTLTMPTTTVTLKASGAAGTTIQPAVSEFQSTANVMLNGTIPISAAIYAWPAAHLTSAQQASGQPLPPPLVTPLATTAITAPAKGYWMVASDGGTFSYGDASFYGSTGSMHLNKPIVGMASTPDGKGYWLVASDGGIFSYGDASFYGSTGSLTLNKPVVGIASTPGGQGYWLVASDGGIFSFGDASFFGSTGSLHLNKPVVGMASTLDGKGYWLVASDGGVFSYGDASFYGSTGSMTLNKPVVGMAAVPSPSV